MKITTRVFGEIDIEESKIIHFQGGIVGFPELTDFAIIHDAEKDSENPIRWMQSMQEPNFAMPVMDPLAVCPDYNPPVEDKMLKPIGELNLDSILVLVTLTVPQDVTKLSVNLHAPFIINADERKAIQLIVDPDRYEVRFPIYDIINKED